MLGVLRNQNLSEYEEQYARRKEGREKEPAGATERTQQLRAFPGVGTSVLTPRNPCKCLTGVVTLLKLQPPGVEMGSPSWLVRPAILVSSGFD